MRIQSPVFAAVSLLLVSLTAAVPAVYAQMDHKTLHVAHGWARASLGENPNSAAYVTIHNPTEVADKVVSISCAGAERCAIHNHINEDGVMKMRSVDTLAIEPGAHLEFAPGGYHIMMFDVTAPFVAGEETTITLTFECKQEKAILTITDDGKYFPPDQAKTPNIKSDWNERSIGGLGLYFVKELMDKVSYSKTEKNRNKLILEKQK